MDTLLTEGIALFDEYQFASEYERYCAAVIARVPNVGRAATARVFADNDQRDLLALPARSQQCAHRRRLDTEEVIAATEALVSRTEAIAKMGPYRAPLFRNVEALGARLNLSQAECAVLVLAVLVETVAAMRRVIEIIGVSIRDRGAAAGALAALLDLDRVAIHKALLPTGALAQTDLVRINLHDEDDYLVRARPGLPGILFDEFDAEDALFAQFAKRVRAPTLNIVDYSHLETDVSYIVGLLGAAVAEHEPGINILLYGPPGTGKTELARVATHEADAHLYEVPHTDAEGTSLTQARYAQVCLAQRLLGIAPRAVLMFDETEDLFPTGRGETNRVGKAAFNHLLESNRAPMIWISNHIGHIDPAYLRRFAYALEVKNPNRTVRRRVAQRAFGALVSDDAWIDSIADNEQLVPGQVAQAARVARLVRKQYGVADVAERTLRNSMRALGQRDLSATPASTDFELRYLNCNADVNQLVSSLSSKPVGAMVFYGPPGTGKTALARHIAQHANLPLLMKRASDLLSPWVGESERAIAQAFEQASDERAVLTIDEADSFLSDRRDARARWELTETNELLTQMESFAGLFICSTNLIDRLDRAAMRRFAVKLRFDYLRSEQIAGLVADTLRRIGVTIDVDRVALECSKLTNLTAGDVAAVVRRYRMLNQIPDARGFAESLRQEVILKQDGGAHRIGFC